MVDAENPAAVLPFASWAGVAVAGLTPPNSPEGADVAGAGVVAVVAAGAVVDTGCENRLGVAEGVADSAGAVVVGAADDAAGAVVVAPDAAAAGGAPPKRDFVPDAAGVSAAFCPKGFGDPVAVVLAVCPWVAEGAVGLNPSETPPPNRLAPGPAGLDTSAGGAPAGVVEPSVNPPNTGFAGVA